MSIRLKTDPASTAEIIFHSVWGSHWEDLEILKFMTGRDFQTRRKLADALRGKGTTANLLTVTNIGIAKYAKLSQALPTSFTSGGSQQVWNKTVFAGKRKTSQSGLFTEHLSKMRTIPGGSGETHNLFNYYSNYKNHLSKTVLEAGEIEQGVAEWKSSIGLTDKEDGEHVAAPPSIVPRLFMSNEIC